MEKYEPVTCAACRAKIGILPDYEQDPGMRERYRAALRTVHEGVCAASQKEGSL